MQIKKGAPSFFSKSAYRAAIDWVGARTHSAGCNYHTHGGLESVILHHRNSPSYA
jgi:hypothetical protein